MAFTTIQKPGRMDPASTSVLPENIITEMSKADFQHALATNPGGFIIKFGAEWCGPCKKIDPMVRYWFSKFPATMQCAIIDIDESFELYAFLKTKKQVNGVPVILFYKKGNMNWIPDDVIVGADEPSLTRFFEKCLNALSAL